jgi:hypothetical protein
MVVVSISQRPKMSGKQFKPKLNCQRRILAEGQTPRLVREMSEINNKLIWTMSGSRGRVS